MSAAQWVVLGLLALGWVGACVALIPGGRQP